MQSKPQVAGTPSREDAAQAAYRAALLRQGRANSAASPDGAQLAGASASVAAPATGESNGGNRQARVPPAGTARARLGQGEAAVAEAVREFNRHVVQVRVRRAHRCFHGRRAALEAFVATVHTWPT